LRTLQNLTSVTPQGAIVRCRVSLNVKRTLAQTRKMGTAVLINIAEKLFFQINTVG
jgi:hypothetical protein